MVRGQNLEVVGPSGNHVWLPERMGCTVKKLLAFVVMMTLVTAMLVPVVGCGTKKPTSAAAPAGGTTDTGKGSGKAP
jgi:hypothetical protein